MRRLATLAGLVLVALCLLGVSSAAVLPHAGTLDPSFGHGGLVTGPSGGVSGIAVQPDGKIVVAGGSVLARYLPNGSPDPSFGNGGVVDATADAVALQPDGKIVVVGGQGLPGPDVFGEFLVARYNPNGSLDTSFGADGVTTTNTFGTCGDDIDFCASRASAVAILPDGDILAAGSGSAYDYESGCCDRWYAFARYTPSGSLDPTFGKGGIVQTGGLASLQGIAVLPSGAFVASGAGSFDDHGDVSVWMDVARFLPDGAIDPSFGTGGGTSTLSQLGYCGGPPALQGGRIVVLGTHCLNANGDPTSTIHPVLARYGANGRLDRSFGTDGFATIGSVSANRSHFYDAPAVATEPDGKILFAAFGSVVRLLPNGRLDQKFGERGIVSLGGHISSLAPQTDGRILVGGSGGSWSLARLIAWRHSCVVPRVAGETIADATAALKKAYCIRGTLGWRSSGTVPSGHVMYAVPARGTRHPPGYAVELVVSEG